MKLVILRGIPGSGKSTLAKQYVERGYKRFNKDDLRAMIDDCRHSKDNEFFVHQAQLALIEGAMIKGYRIVVDNTHGKEKVVKELRDLAEERGYEVEEVVLDTPLATCIARDSVRHKAVGEAVVRQFAEMPFFAEIYRDKSA